MHAELQARCDLGKGLFGALATGQTVGDNADMMAALGPQMSGRTIDEVPTRPSGPISRVPVTPMPSMPAGNFWRCATPSH